MTELVSRAADRGVRKRVLVVDDEPLIRWSLAETLRHHGYTVVEAANAQSAIEAASNVGKPFGVVVLDIRLPDSNDLTLLTSLRGLMSDARIILMTAHGSPELVQRAREYGAFCVLHKPFGMTALADIVDQASYDQSNHTRLDRSC